MDSNKETLENIRELINNFRSNDQAIKKLTLSQIPALIHQSLESKNDILNQLFLVIYNVTIDQQADQQGFEVLNETNRISIFRHLLRLYTTCIDEHQHKQIESLIKIIDFAQTSSELLTELAHVLHKCTTNLTSKEDLLLIEEALGCIQEKAASNLHSEALLMIHSIIAIK